MSVTSRREFLHATAAAPFLQRAPRTGPPNILLLFPDQLRPEWTDPAAHLDVRLPHLEALAARGVRFTNAVTPSPLCAPARACLALGMDYPRCGVASNKYDMPLDRPTFYQRLRESGYHVMGCGKLDLHKATLDWGLDGRRLLAEWGFSDGIDNAGKRDATRSGADQPKDPYMAMLHRRNLAAAHVADFQSRRNYAATFPTPLPDDAYCDNWIGANGLALLDRAPRDKPWFLAVNYTGPHEPLDITGRMEKTARGRSYPQPCDTTQFDEPTHIAIRQNYTVMTENIDAWTGRFVEALRDRGELNNTLIVFSSDHGEMLGDHARWGKSVPWQPSVGVPLVFAGPGVRRGLANSAPATTLDLTATFLDFAGAPALAGMDSRTLRPVLEGKTRTTRNVVASGLDPWRMASDGRWKLIADFEKVPERLYDIKDDPQEMKDLAARRPDIVRRLRPNLAL